MRWWKRNWVELLILIFLGLVVGSVVWRNYTHGTFLTGIDNFHIEFDLPLALQRAWSGVWQDNQGLGIVSGLAQMTELSRIAVYYAISWVMPTSVIRYAFTFGNLFLGIVGTYYLTRYSAKSRVAGLGAALFYLFNLNTLQVFFMPTEMFVVNYAALPWLFYLVFKYLSEGKKTSLVWYAALLFLSAPMAMTPTIFLIYGLFLTVMCLVSREWKRVWRVGLVTVGMSAYFLLPFGYFGATQGQIVQSAKINQSFSVENYLSNASRTTVRDLITLKGMWFDYPDRVDGKYVSLLGVWEQHLASMEWMLYIPALIIGIGAVTILAKRRWWGVGVVVVGLVALVILRGENPPVGILVAKLRELPLVAEALRTPFTKVAPILALMYAICFGVGVRLLATRWKVVQMVVIAGVVGILGWIYAPYWTGNLVSQGVRVSIPQQYFDLFREMKKLDRGGRVVNLPAHTSQAWQYTDWGYRGSGFLWYGIEQPILDRAFDVWSPYNEGFYDELSTAMYGCGDGAQGNLKETPPASGVPTRDSLGSPVEESPCGKQVSKVLQKYDVRYVLLDESVIAPGQGKEFLRIEETKKLSEELGWEEVFHENFLSVWEIPERSDLVGVNPTRSDLAAQGRDPGEQWVTAPREFTWVGVDTGKVRRDVVYEDVGTYVEHGDGVIYPFAGLMREQTNNVEWGEGMVRITNSELRITEGQELVIPGWEVGEIVRVDFENSDPLPAYYVNNQLGPRFLGEERPKDGQSYFFAKVGEGEEWEEYRKEQKFEIRNEKLEIEVRGEPFVYDFVKQGQGSIGNCDVLKRGVAIKTEITYFADERGAVCDYVVMEAPFTRVPYLLRLRGENVEGRSIKFFLYNTGSKRNDIEYLLGKGKFDQTFSLLPWAWDGYYTLNIETRSFGQRAENRIEPVVGMYVPLEKIARAKIAPVRSDLVGFDQELQPTRSDLEITHVKKTGTWLYGVGVKGNGQFAVDSDQGEQEGLIRLSQGYDEGWVGIQWSVDSRQWTVLKHVKVDGWSNGWIVKVNPPLLMASDGHSGWMVSKQETVDSDQSEAPQIVVIFYWPQMLEYLGFGLLGLTILFLVFPKTKNK